MTTKTLTYLFVLAIASPLFYHLGVDADNKCQTSAAPPVSEPVISTKDLDKSSGANTRVCDKVCAIEALSGETLSRGRQRYCDARCPEYKVPEEALDPEALCTRCCDEDCELCACRTGICVKDEDNDFAVKIAGGGSVGGGYCSDCRPRRKCRQFWWC